MGNLLSRLAGPFREFGAFSGLLYAASRVLPMLSPRLNLYVYDLMVQPVTGKALLPQRLSQAFSVAPIGPEAAELGLMPAPRSVIEGRFAQGSICLGAWRGGQLTGYMWLCPSRYDEDEVRCRYQLLPAGQSVFDFDVHIFPEHRLGFAFVALWNGANHWLQDQGVKFSFSRISRFNVASRRAHTRLGCRRLGSAAFLRAGQAQVMVATVSPYVDISTRSTASPTMNLQPPASDLPVSR
ncbi:MAG: hypothetical protein JNM50_11160 [Chromatiales bacterium]|nr:hypothetical protein [Chromatiales bacterium]